MNVQEIRAKLIPLYAQIAELTRPECANACRIPFGCCNKTECEIVIRTAKKYWGVSLPLTDHPKLPLMGPNGCTAPPHLRPCCSVHTCEINKSGEKAGDPEWTAKYYDLFDEINCLEADLLVMG